MNEIAGIAPTIVNISSISAYTSSTQRAEILHLEGRDQHGPPSFTPTALADEGINVYEIRPGVINTDMTSVVKDKYDALIDGGLTPIKRWGQPEDVGPMRFPWSVPGCCASRPAKSSTSTADSISAGCKRRRSAADLPGGSDYEH